MIVINYIIIQYMHGLKTVVTYNNHCFTVILPFGAEEVAAIGSSVEKIDVDIAEVVIPGENIYKCVHL